MSDQYRFVWEPAMIAVHLENLVFLLFIAVAFLFQLLTRAATKANRESDESDATKRRANQPSPGSRAHPETDEERVRKFLEALGQPPGSKPPPPITARKMDPEVAAAEALYRVEQERRAAQQPTKPFRPARPGLPPLTTFPPPLSREVKPVERPGVSREKRIYRPKVEEAPTFEVHDVARPTEPAVSIEVPEQANAVQVGTPGTGMGQDFVALLKSPSGLRNAIILREIFGPPRGVQSFELL